MNPELLRRLPKMDLLLARPALAEHPLPYPVKRQAARQVLDDCRRALREGALASVPGPEELEGAVLRLAERLSRPALGRVINATGIVLHTNLGRAPLSRRAAEAVGQAARGYSNLEYDLPNRCRGLRGEAAEELLCALTGAEGALAVNNNAAAVFLLLSALAAGQGVAISRGELVARLVEVGTTNKTRPADYAAALERGEAQAMLKVHPSNFRVVGFTQSASLPELGELARSRGVPLLCDLGSAAPGSPELKEAVTWADVVCFSGDKLLGGPQAGILLGKAELIGRLRADPLARALRIDKLSLAALEATLLDWRDGTAVPVSAMLSAEPAELRARAEALREALNPLCPCDVVETAGEVGGGSRPGEALPAWAVALSPAEVLDDFFRRRPVPILGRIHRSAPRATWITARPPW